MLVLTRKNQESITITVPGCEPIVVKMVYAHSDRCKIGVDAPIGVRVMRSEVIKRSENHA